jgi:signal transduction histidine kinase
MGLQARIVLVVLLALLGESAVALVLFQSERAQGASYRGLLDGSVRVAEESRRVQVLFKKQVQAWKDILLRGADPADRARYQDEFDALDLEVDAATAALAAEPLPAPTRALLERFRADHVALDERYRIGRARFEASGGHATFEVDRLVRGLDRPPTDLLDALVEAAHRDEADALARINQQASSRTLVTLVLSVSVLAVVLLLALLGARRIAGPIVAAEGLAQRLAAGELDAGPAPAASGPLGEALHEVLLTLGRHKKENEELEEQIADHGERLQASQRELAGLAYVIAHDLRAPVRHISAFTSRLAERAGAALDPEASRYLGIIAASGQRLGLLIDGLLELSRVARQTLARAPTPLGPLVAAVLEELAPRARGRAVEWNVGALPTVECDANLVREAVRQLVDNALKFSRGKTPARITIGVDSDGAIFVRDNGEGFDPRYAGKLFGVFERLHRGAEPEGVGVGLALVQRVAERHGGKAFAHGVPGEGATFSFTLG